MCRIFDLWENIRPQLVRAVFKRAAFMTRYGRITFNEAMAMHAWYRCEYMEALSELIREEQDQSGGLTPDLLEG
jgi:hypothetical protein